MWSCFNSEFVEIISSTCISSLIVRKNIFWTYPANTKHLYNICTTWAQRLRRWSNIVQMLYNVLCLLGRHNLWNVKLFEYKYICLVSMHLLIRLCSRPLTLHCSLRRCSQWASNLSMGNATQHPPQRTCFAFLFVQICFSAYSSRKFRRMQTSSD